MLRSGRRRALFLALAVGLVVGGTTVALSATADADIDRCRAHAMSRARAAAVTGSGASIVVIGDSYSVGYGIPAESAGAWPSRLPGRVHVDGFPGSGFSAFASECGTEVSFAERAARALTESGGEPDLVVVQGGLNDHDQSDEMIERGFQRLMQAIGDRPVLVVGPPSGPDRVGTVPHIDGLLARLAQEHGARYLRMTAHAFPYLPDGLHLTAEGHRLFGDEVAKALAEL